MKNHERIVSKKDLINLKKQIQALEKEQQKLFDNFIKKHKIPRNTVPDEIVWDYSFNNFENIKNVILALRDWDVKVK